MTCDAHEYQTDNLDLAAFLTAHGRDPGVYREQGRQLVTFHFCRDDILLALIEEFSTGTATISAKALLSSRRRLFHALRQLREGSHAM